MGGTWEVNTFVPHETEPNKYEWVPVYMGNSLIIAVLAAIKEKRRYSLGCVQINWR